MRKKLHRPWLFVLTIGLGTLLNPLNSSMISVAVTRIQNEFALTFADASWLISIFYIASAVGQPVMGKLSDMFGPKRLFLSGLLLVSVSSILAPFSPNYITLLAFRALQAIGSSTLFPSGMSLIRANITEKQGRALATLSVYSSTSAAFGPSIGGFLIDSWDWPSIFLINLPFIIISFMLAIIILPNQGQGKIEIKRIDFVGITLFVIAVYSLILFLLSLETQINWWGLVGFILGSLGFYFYERRSKEPFIDVVALSRNHNLLFIYIQFMIINLVHYCYFFGFPTFLQQSWAYSAKDTGLIMLALAGPSVIVAPLVGRMIDRFSSKIALVVGAILLLAGTALLLTLKDTSSIAWFLVIMVVLGIAAGFNNISTQISIYEHARAEDTGTASGLLLTSRYLGSIMSASLLGLTFNHHVNIENLNLVTIICVIFSVFVVALVILFPRKAQIKVRTKA